MALKISAFGFSNYWQQGANRFDFVITWIILIGQTALILDPTQTVASKVGICLFSALQKCQLFEDILSFFEVSFLFQVEYLGHNATWIILVGQTAPS
jgi:hypothetical protein